MLKQLSSFSSKKDIVKLVNYRESIVEEQIVIEKAITIYLNEEEFVTMVSSPGFEQELLLGFLASEGVISKKDDILKVRWDECEGLVWVETKARALGQKLFLKRYLTSCCGKGRSSFYFANDARLSKKIQSNLQISAEDVYKYSSMLEEHSEVFRLTGGVHGGAIAAEGNFEFYAYDIGRHNILDKLYGWALEQEINLSHKALMFSGRISSEILIKTGKMGCPILIGRSAPTDLALNLAEELGITVIGFARENRMNIYTYPERIIR
jgi:FdhD protein